MLCFCPSRLDSLAHALQALPPLGGLAPSVPALPSADAGGSAAGSVSIGIQPAALARLSALASLSQAWQASQNSAFAMALTPPRLAATQARLEASVASFNAQGAVLAPLSALLQRVAADLMTLMPATGLAARVQAAYGIDLRTRGAVPALQARLAAMVTGDLPQAGATGALGTAGAGAVAPVSATGALLSSLGLSADAPGLAAAQAQVAALAQVMAGVPALGSGFAPLSLLSAVMTMLAAVRSAWRVDLLLPDGLPQLRNALAVLPVDALASLPVFGAGASMQGGVAVGIGAALQTPAQRAAGAAMDAAMAPVLARLAVADLGAAEPVALLLGTMAQAGLGRPAGSCVLPCPIAMR